MKTKTAIESANDRGPRLLGCLRPGRLAIFKCGLECKRTHRTKDVHYCSHSLGEALSLSSLGAPYPPSGGKLLYCLQFPPLSCPIRFSLL